MSASALSIVDFEGVDYDPFAADAVNFGDHPDPYPRIAEWRARSPVLEGSYRELFDLPYAMMPDRRCFTVVGTREVQKALTTPDIFSNGGYEFNIGATFGRSISVMDPPEHTRWRRIFQKIFLPQNIANWGGTVVDSAVHKLLDPHLPNGRIDLVEDFTLLYPFEIIYRQLNLPQEDEKVFHRLAIGQTDYANEGRAREASAKLGDYFANLVAKRRADPGDDLVSGLALTEVEGEYLPEEILISFLRQLMNAAGDTTYRGTSILLTCLLRNPDQLEAVRQDRKLVPLAIEEALRWDGPVVVQLRMAAVDTELGGVTIPAGSLIDVVAGAANRDPEVYPNPDTFDIKRDRKPHFSFARGPHICVGQHLARIEMTRALNIILDTMPNLRLDPDQPPPDIRGTMMRVPHHIHGLFDPA
jgi:cytochrome P450